MASLETRVPRSAGAASAAAPPGGPNFDRVARVYRWAEYLTLGGALARTREHFLPQLAAARRAVILGDGDGRFTAALLRSNRHVRVHAVDLSGVMLGLLRNRCARLGFGDRVSIERASVLEARLPEGADLVATHFLLDCLPQSEVHQLAAQLARVVVPGGLWVVSEFGLPGNRFFRPLAAVYIRLLYLAFRVLTGLRPQHLPDPQTALLAAGFRRLGRAAWLGGLLYSELWQLSEPPGAGAGRSSDMRTCATSAAGETSTSSW